MEYVIGGGYAIYAYECIAMLARPLWLPNDIDVYMPYCGEATDLALKQRLMGYNTPTLTLLSIRINNRADIAFTEKRTNQSKYFCDDAIIAVATYKMNGLCEFDPLQIMPDKFVQIVIVDHRKIKTPGLTGFYNCIPYLGDTNINMVPQEGGCVFLLDPIYGDNLRRHKLPNIRDKKRAAKWRSRGW